MNIIHQVFLAVDGEGFLPMNEKISLEYLSSDMNGIFESEQSWKSFVNGNFLSDYSKEYWRDEMKESTIKKWCIAEKEYKNLFVVKVGADKYQTVNHDDIVLSFDYELGYSKNHNNFPTSAEIFVTAKFKG